MEPEWTKKVPNWVVCDWFYAFFAINAAVFVLLLLMGIYLAFVPGLGKTFRAIQLAGLLFKLAIAGTSTLFYYLICDRSLKPTQ